jgi:hypothetical protein
MKKELREEIKNGGVAKKEKPGLYKLIEDNKGVVKALGIASFVALAGYSATQLLKDKKLMKKIKGGIKTPKGLKYVEELLGNTKTTTSKSKSGKSRLPEIRDAVKGAGKKKSAAKTTAGAGKKTNKK